MTRGGVPGRDRRHLRHGLLAVAAVVGILATSACGADDQRVADVPADTTAHPVVQLGQAGTVLSAVDAALVRNRGVTSAAKLDSRLLGPYRDLSLARAKVADKRKQKVPEAGEFTLTKLLVPKAAGWPRFFVAVGESSDSATPTLRVLSSESARDPYGLWAQTSMLPGATLPPVAAPDAGAELLPATTSGLVATPAKTVQNFATYLNDDGKGTGFARSSYSTQIVARLKDDRKKLKSVAKVDSKHTATGTPLALRTASGGALVIGELKQTYTLTTKGSREVALTDKDLSALAAGKKTFGKSFTRTSVEVVVFYVPPAGKGQITVVAADKGDVKAVAK